MRWDYCRMGAADEANCEKQKMFRSEKRAPPESLKAEENRRVIWISRIIRRSYLLFQPLYSSSTASIPCLVHRHNFLPFGVYLFLQQFDIDSRSLTSYHVSSAYT